MILCITGATGFLGRATVRQALAEGHQLRVLSRRPAAAAQPGVSHHQLSLHDGVALEAALTGADAVIHLAAAMGGSEESHRRDTVEATQALIAAMRRCGLRRLVGVSSFAVYGTALLPDGALLSEASPIEPQPEARDAYTRAKLAQEALLRAAGAELSVLITRPGIVYGPGHYWVAAVGHRLGSGWLAIGAAAELPLVHVDNCAEALLRAATGNATGIVNLVDDFRPGAIAYRRAIQTTPDRVRWLLPLPLWVLHALSRIAAALNQGLFRGRLPLPGLLRASTLAARFKPLRYDNTLARQRLGWTPKPRELQVAPETP